jgi:ligand-binding sensor domain-containing protein
MLKHLVLIGIAAVSCAVYAQDDDIDEKDVKAEEIIYEKPTEWSVYPSDEPVIGFAIRGDELWYATASTVNVASIKKRLVQTFSKLGTIPASDVTSIASDGKNVWIGGKNGAAIRSGKSFEAFTKKNGLPDNSVNAVVVAAGKAWIGTDNGLACYSGGSWKTFTTQNGLPHNKVTALMVDNNNRLWVGTMKGIGVYDGSSWKVHDMKKGMSWNQVKALAFDPRKKTVWAAVGEQDVNSFIGNEWNTFMDIAEDITSIMVDTQSRVWIGSSSGLIKYNGDEWINDPKKLGIPAAQVNWMYRDGSGNLYYACENGIVRLLNPYPF